MVFGKKKQLMANGMLLLAALLWGSGFVAQKENTLTPLLFNGLRYGIATMVILIFVRFQLPLKWSESKYFIVAGAVMWIAAILQQYGIRMTSIGNTSFITTIYVVLVPYLSYILFRTKITKKSVLAGLISLLGLYLLSTGGRTLDQISIGDGFVFISAIFWALHIIIIERANGKIHPLQFSAGQFAVCAALNIIFWLIVDRGSISGWENGALPVLYSGLIVIAGGFTLQALFLRYTTAADGAIILGLESVFGAMFGVFLFHETYNGVQILGTALIFGAVLIAIRRSEVHE